ALDVRHLESEGLRDRRRDVTAQYRAERLASGDPCTSREEERAVLRLRRQVAVRAAVVRGRDHLVALRLVDEVVAALGLEGQIPDQRILVGCRKSELSVPIDAPHRLDAFDLYKLTTQVRCQSRAV